MVWLKKKKKREIRNVSPHKLLIVKQVLIGIFLALTLALLFYGVWHFTRIEALNIKEIEVIGGETLDYEEIKKIIEVELQGNYYKMVPKTFVMTYPRSVIMDRLDGIERIKNYHFEVVGTKLILALEEYQPVALWCPNTDSRECWFLDYEAFAFGRAPTLEGGAFLRIVSPEKEPQIGERPVSREQLETMNQFMQKLYDELKFNVTNVVIDTPEEYSYTLAGGGVLKVTSEQEVAETVENLKAILGFESFSHLGPGKFKYIDLRYGNKVFVNEELESLATSTENSDAAVSTSTN